MLVPKSSSAAGATLVAAVFLSTSVSAATGPYAKAPLDRYMTASRQSEVDLARSAAPPSISSRATVLVLTSHGYVVTAKGTNGFTCLVERAWMSPFDSIEFWNWHMHGPICYNPPASRTVLQYTLARTNLVLSGLNKSQILERVQAEAAAGSLPSPEPGSMSYMMSKHGFLGDGVGSWYSHLMIYTPKGESANDGASWGADLAGSPVAFDNGHRVVPEPETIMMVIVPRWSDGTAAPKP